jgi:hypothetical protein
VSGFGVPLPILDCVVKLGRGQKIPNVVFEVGDGMVPRVALKLGVGAWKWGMARRGNGGGRERVRGQVSVGVGIRNEFADLAWFGCARKECTEIWSCGADPAVGGIHVA